MLPQQIDLTVSRIGLRHSQFTASLTAAYVQVVQGYDPTSAKARRALEQRMAAVLVEHRGALTEDLQAGVQEVTRLGFGALGDVQVSSQDIEEHEAEVLNFAVGGQWAVMTQCVSQCRDELRKVGLMASLAPDQANLEIIRARAIGGFEYLRADSIGRKRKSIDHARLSARGALVLGYVDAAVFAAHRAGRSVARVIRPSRKEAYDVSITGDDAALPAYRDIRRDVFHPNSTAYVELATA